MSELSRSPTSPPLLLMALAMMLLAIVGAWYGSQHRPDLRASLAPVTHVEAFVFVGGDDEPLQVIDADDGSLVIAFAPGEASFIRGMLRGIGRERQVDGVSAAEPLVVASRADGSITVDDAATGILYDLRAFGSSNQAAFAALLSAAAVGHGLATGPEDDNLQSHAVAPPAP
jgi:putative photosynthetic complex assembly protein